MSPHSSTRSTMVWLSLLSKEIHTYCLSLHLFWVDLLWSCFETREGPLLEPFGAFTWLQKSKLQPVDPSIYGDFLLWWGHYIWSTSSGFDSNFHSGLDLPDEIYVNNILYLRIRVPLILQQTVVSSVTLHLKAVKKYFQEREWMDFGFFFDSHFDIKISM